MHTFKKGIIVFKKTASIYFVIVFNISIQFCAASAILAVGFHRRISDQQHFSKLSFSTFIHIVYIFYTIYTIYIFYSTYIKFKAPF